MMMTEKIEQIRQTALAKVRENALEEAITLFDEALSLSSDDEITELLTINKAGVLIQMEKDGPETQKLPMIVMRRRSPRHTFLAAYNLQHKFMLASDFRRSYNYGRIALEQCDEVGEPIWRIGVLNEMGRACVADSQFDNAVEHLEEVLSLLESSPDQILAGSFARQNLGYALLSLGRCEDGISLIHEALELMDQADAMGYAAESYVDLCYGYLELGELNKARHYGTLGLEQATETRQERNGHYLLGEIAYKLGDIAAAEQHFEVLANHYPDFPNLKDVLLALDLRKMVNLKI